MRLRIACHCARALVYLHHDCSPALIHRDLKSSNILLDEEFHGYLADFGLARKLRPETSHVSTVIAGTLGYVPPEYSQIWRATTKGDVYSFGVVMLELITGRQPIFTAASPGLNLTRNRGGQVSEFESYNVVDWVRFLMKEQRGHEAYHAVVKDTVGRGKEAQLAQFIELAMACTLDASDLRPTIKEVSIALESMLLDSEGT
jgi:serine/threonine protein kinase